MQINQLFTREIAEQGKKVYLTDINGNPINEWLLVVGSESDSYRLSVIKAVRENRISQSSDAEMLDSNAKLLSNAITGWSFEDEFSQDAAYQLLRNAPYIAQQVDKAVSEFFADSEKKEPS